MHKNKTIGIKEYCQQQIDILLEELGIIVSTEELD